MMEAISAELPAVQDNRFTDVGSDNPNAAAIAEAARLGLVSGDMDAKARPLRTFRLDEPINRAEVAKIVVLLIDGIKR